MIVVSAVFADRQYDHKKKLGVITSKMGEMDGDEDVAWDTMQCSKWTGSNNGRRNKKMTKSVDEVRSMNSKIERTGSLISILATPANVRFNTDALFRYERTRRILYIIIEHKTSI